VGRVNNLAHPAEVVHPELWLDPPDEFHHMSARPRARGDQRYIAAAGCGRRSFRAPARGAADQGESQFAIDRGMRFGAVAFGHPQSTATDGSDARTAHRDPDERQAGDVVELQYDSLAIETLYLGAKLTDVRRLTPETYEPRACVRLIDACYATINAGEETVLRRRDEPRVLVVFLAGGDDDSSCNHTVDELRSQIEGRRAEGWQFIMLGAEFNAYTAARAFGINEEATVSYEGLLGCRQSMTATAEAAGAFAGGRLNGVGFTADQKRAAQDRYWDADPDEITISDEAIDRAMIVTRPRKQWTSSLAMRRGYLPRQSDGRTFSSR
jgi:hypothetical protein